MFRILSSDWLKTKRTVYRTISFLMPPAVALVSLWYISVHNQTPAFQSNAYTLFFSLWTILIPLLVGLLAGILGFQEEQAGNFNGLLDTSIPRAQVFSGKLLFLILTTAIGLFVSILLYIAGLELFLHVSDLRVAVFITGAFLTLLGSFALCVLHLWLSFAFGMGASISIGGAGFLIAAICGLTSAGDRIWYFLPWTWPARLAQIPVSFSRFESSSGGDPAVVLPAILLFILSAICAIAWFDRWEGRKSYD